jgi:membrane associated rhomboid family serine protease
MGTFFILILIGVSIALGFLDKGDKFWSAKTFGTLAFFVACAIGGLFADSGKALTDTEKIRGTLVLMSGSVFGLIYCVLYTSEIKEKKKFSIMTGIPSVLISMGWFFIIIGVARWLNGIS